MNGVSTINYQLSTMHSLYNGKELQQQTQFYDYGFRQQDPQLGRWHSVDKLAESYHSVSPYAYVGNSPINRSDYLGLKWINNNYRTAGMEYKGTALSSTSRAEEFANEVNDIFNSYGSTYNFAGSFSEYYNAFTKDGFAKISGFLVNSTNLVFHAKFFKKGGLYSSDEEDQKTILGILSATFGVNHNFKFKGAKLVHDGNINFESENILYWVLLAAMHNKKKGNISFTNTIIRLEHNDVTEGTIEWTYDIFIHYGGGVTAPNKKETICDIYIMKNENYTTGSGLYSTQATIFWHELGHFLFLHEPTFAVKIENEYRGIKGNNLTQRNYNGEHPKSPAINQFWDYEIFRNMLIFR